MDVPGMIVRWRLGARLAPKSLQNHWRPGTFFKSGIFLYESCREFNYESNATWIAQIGVRMRKLRPKYSKLFLGSFRSGHIDMGLCPSSPYRYACVLGEIFQPEWPHIDMDNPHKTPISICSLHKMEQCTWAYRYAQLPHTPAYRYSMGWLPKAISICSCRGGRTETISYRYALQWHIDMP